MIRALALLLGFQLAGEAAARLVLPALPGPVIGLLLLLGALLVLPGLAQAIRPVATGLLAHLSLFFVPAGVGVLAELPRIADQWLPIAAALVLSTLAAIAAAAFAFRLTARALGERDG